MPLRLRTRLTLWYSCVLTAVLALFALTVTWQQGRIGLRRMDRELDGLTATVSGLLQEELAEIDPPTLAATEVVETLGGSGRYHVAILAHDGRAIATSPGGPTFAVATSAAGVDGRTWAETTTDGRWRVGGRRVELGGDVYYLLGGAPLADAGRDLLRRMVLNLLQNAVQHTRSGGRVDVSVLWSDTEASIVVADEGPGIPMADRARIFDRFVQLDSARRRAGAGLGLPISRWIAEAHGGRVELLSTSAVGSTFVASLPVAMSAQERSTEVTAVHGERRDDD